MYYGDSIDHEYFEKYDYEKSPYLSLKEHYVNRWAPYFDENDTVSDEIIAEIKQFKLLTFRNPSLTTITEFQKNNEIRVRPHPFPFRCIFGGLSGQFAYARLGRMDHGKRSNL